MLTLGDLTIGEKAKVKGFGATSLSYRQRLLSMGITKGTEFTVVGKAPLGCPLAIEVRQCILTLRHHEASCVIVDRLLCVN